MKGSYFSLIPRELKRELDEYILANVIVEVDDTYLSGIKDDIQYGIHRGFTDDSSIEIIIMIPCRILGFIVEFIKVALQIEVKDLKSFITRNRNYHDLSDKSSELGIYYLSDSSYMHIYLENRERTYTIYSFTPLQGIVLLSKLQQLIRDINNNTLQESY